MSFFEDVPDYDDDNDGEPRYRVAPERPTTGPRGGGLRGVIDRVIGEERRQRGLLDAHNAMVHELSMLGVEIPR